MKYFALNLEAISPLAIRADHSPEGVDALRYISGSTLIGSLATVYRFAYPNNSADFERLFLSGQIQFPDLYPALFKQEEMQEKITLPVFPFPRTARTCKRSPGFSHLLENQDKDDAGHGVRDSLLDWTIFALADNMKVDNPDILLSPFPHSKEFCQRCDNTMEYDAKHYRRENEDMIIANSTTRLQTHTGIDRSTGTVQEGILYNRRVFDEHTRFWGLLKVSDDVEATFKDCIKEFGTSGLIRVGTGRTRGMGKVHLTIQPIDEDEQKRKDTFSTRLRNFNAALQDAAQTFNNEWDLRLDLKPFYFALTLHSPALLRDSLLRYRGSITNVALGKLLELSKNHFELIYQDASTKRVTGWSELWGTPRTNEIAIDTASVFLYGSDLPQNELEEALFKLENEGIGQRKAEGFGRICISDPFHMEVKPR